jgi:hypothetical protein
MPFIGNKPALSYTSFAKQDFTTSVTTSYTLDNPVANANELALFINFVRQEPTTAYSASGTSLTLTSATSATDDMYCVFLGKAVQTVNPPAGSVGADVTTNWERNDNTGYASLGTGLTESSGIFSFPETGLYYIVYTAFINMDSTDPNVTYQLRVTTNNSTYDIVSNTASGNGSSVSGVATTFTNSYIINVTDITNVKFKFQTNNFDAGTFLYGFSSRQWTGFLILRIGDSQ